MQWLLETILLYPQYSFKCYAINYYVLCYVLC